MALHELRQTGQWEVVSLLTVLTADYDRVSMHGIRRELLEAQAAAAGLALRKVYIPAGGDMAEYERAMAEAMDHFRRMGVRHAAFGDLYLEGIREYREKNLARAGMEAVFPLWGRDTRVLAEEIIDAGFRAVLTCVDGEKLDRSFAGRSFDRQLLADLPAGIDPCGENGEFHTFIHAGPILDHPIPCRTGEVVTREGRFHFCDVLPG